jgi:hypothetical protein
MIYGPYNVKSFMFFCREGMK